MTLKMPGNEASQALAGLNQACDTHWRILDDRLNKTFKFKNFIEAFDFMTEAAKLAEAADHHPDWCNAYNQVTINLTTHEVGGLSSRDFTLASKIESINSV